MPRTVPLPVAARRATVALLALLALLATSCALQPPAAPPAVDWAARGAALTELAGWQARGRIALKAEGRGGQGDLAWQQSGAQAHIRVSGPFGAGAYEIRWDPAGLSVASRDGEFSRAWTGADAAEQFLAEQVGWSFPAVSTRWWLLALPDPEHPAEQTLAADGSLAELTQNGWSVRYERYVESGGWPMPARLTVESARARLRVVIDRWCLAPDCLDSP